MWLEFFAAGIEFLFLLMLCRRSASTPPSEDGSHENEGFLKSMWHTLTNHPSHQKKPDGDGESKTTPPGDETKKDGETGEKPNKEPGSGS